MRVFVARFRLERQSLGFVRLQRLPRPTWDVLGEGVGKGADVRDVARASLRCARDGRGRRPVVRTTAERGAAGGEARAARAREVSSHRRDRRRRADASGGRSRGSRRGRDGGRVRARGVRAPEARGRRAGQCAPGAAPQRERRSRQGAERPPRARHIPLLLGSPENAAGTEGCARRDDRASEASRRRDLHARRGPTTRGSREGRGPTIRRVSPGDARTGVPLGRRGRRD